MATLQLVNGLLINLSPKKMPRKADGVSSTWNSSRGDSFDFLNYDPFAKRGVYVTSPFSTASTDRTAVGSTQRYNSKSFKTVHPKKRKQLSSITYVAPTAQKSNNSPFAGEPLRGPDHGTEANGPTTEVLLAESNPFDSGLAPSRHPSKAPAKQSRWTIDEHVKRAPRPMTGRVIEGREGEVTSAAPKKAKRTCKSSVTHGLFIRSFIANCKTSIKKLASCFTHSKDKQYRVQPSKTRKLFTLPDLPSVRFRRAPKYRPNPFANMPYPIPFFDPGPYQDCMYPL